MSRHRYYINVTPENWKRIYTKLQHDISYTESLMVCCCAEFTGALYFISMQEKVSVHGKTTTEAINDSRCMNGPEENNPSLRRSALLHSRGQLSSFEIVVLALVMDICHGRDTRYRAPPPTKKHRDGIIDDACARATVTADQIFTTPTSLDVYNFRANWPRDRVATHHPNGRAPPPGQVIPVHSPPPV